MAIDKEALVYRWTWSLKSPPEALWPLVSNTDRFNRDCGFPSVKVIPAAAGHQGLVTNGRRVRAKVSGMNVEWDERPFEWEEPRQFSVMRTYHSGPVLSMLSTCQLKPNGSGGTELLYEITVAPKGFISRQLVRYGVGKRSYSLFDRTFRLYDRYAQEGLRISNFSKPPTLAHSGSERLQAGEGALIGHGAQRKSLVDKLSGYLRTADDMSVSRIRCYAMADTWRENRTETLSLFLHATRAGILDFSWDIVCPHCRGAKQSGNSLADLKSVGRCDTCDVDFTVDFDRSVELTFIPNPSVRPVTRTDYCVGGPQITPHIVAQSVIAANSSRTLTFDLAKGRYRVRIPSTNRLYPFSVDPLGAPHVQADLAASPGPEVKVVPKGRLTLGNTGESELLAIVEHTAWSDQATSAADVTSLQAFRDLFSREVLRPGEQISVGSMTVVFTDLKNSTVMYRQIGDAPAFGRVLSHFDILKSAIADNNGSIVKTMGDAVMAVFREPRSALIALASAKKRLDGLHSEADAFPLVLKAGLHLGSCLAINQNDHLDYFGTTVNLAARLCSLCSGNDLVVSRAFVADPGVTALVADRVNGFDVVEESTRVSGFGEERVPIFRLTAASNRA